MMASYFLSRTVAPTMANFLLGAETHHPEGHVIEKPDGSLARIHWHFIRGFEWGQNRYVNLLEKAIKAPLLVVILAITFVALTLLILIPFLGRDFFPAVDAGQFRLHISRPERHPDRGNGKKASRKLRRSFAGSFRPTKSTWYSITSGCRSAA